MEIVTLVENVMRGESSFAVNARKTHCIRGHVLTGSNVYHPRKYPTRRVCVPCKREECRLRQARRRAAAK